MSTSAVPGTWALTMSTPIGTVRADMTFVDTDGHLTGVATSRSETVELRDVRADPGEDGEHVTWSQSVRRPMRLNLEFDVVVHGDDMEGHARAGRLPASRVTGRRQMD